MVRQHRYTVNAVAICFTYGYGVIPLLILAFHVAYFGSIETVLFASYKSKEMGSKYLARHPRVSVTETGN